MVSTQELDDLIRAHRKRGQPSNQSVEADAAVEEWLRRHKEKEDTLRKTRERLAKWAKE